MLGAKKFNHNHRECTKNPNLPIRPIDKKYLGFTLSFFIRMVYSCLIDADFIDTENYMSLELKPRGNNITIVQLNNIFTNSLSSFVCDNSKINTKRKDILSHCLSMAKMNTGLYTLTVPTGGGKTYSSLAFALSHAAVNNLERIIYVIPYTSIIEQNAKVFKNALGDNNILEHHSNYQFDNNYSDRKVDSLNPDC